MVDDRLVTRTHKYKICPSKRPMLGSVSWNITINCFWKLTDCNLLRSVQIWIMPGCDVPGSPAVDRELIVYLHIAWLGSLWTSSELRTPLSVGNWSGSARKNKKTQNALIVFRSKLSVSHFSLLISNHWSYWLLSSHCSHWLWDRDQMMWCLHHDVSFHALGQTPPRDGTCSNDIITEKFDTDERKICKLF